MTVGAEMERRGDEVVMRVKVGRGDVTGRREWLQEEVDGGFTITPGGSLDKG